MDLLIKKLCLLLESIKYLTNSNVVFYYTDTSIYSQLAEEMKYHRNCFCSEVHQDTEQFKLCMKEDLNDLIINCGNIKKPYVKKCHAGVLELVVPIITNKGYEGAILFGPMRDHQDSDRYPQYEELYQSLPVYSESACKAAENLIVSFVEYYVNAKERMLINECTKNIRNAQIEEAINIINSDPCQNLTVTGIAKKINLSVSRFIHLFREQTGINFSNYLLNLKLERAKKLLVHTNLHIADIAQIIGYHQQSYFCNIFRKNIGFSPTEYRKQQRKSVEKV